MEHDPYLLKSCPMEVTLVKVPQQDDKQEPRLIDVRN